jgi:hypothetical protein
VWKGHDLISGGEISLSVLSLSPFITHGCFGPQVSERRDGTGHNISHLSSSMQVKARSCSKKVFSVLSCSSLDSSRWETR